MRLLITGSTRPTAITTGIRIRIVVNAPSRTLSETRASQGLTDRLRTGRLLPTSSASASRHRTPGQHRRQRDQLRHHVRTHRRKVRVGIPPTIPSSSIRSRKPPRVAFRGMVRARRGSSACREPGKLALAVRHGGVSRKRPVDALSRASIAGRPRFLQVKPRRIGILFTVAARLEPCQSPFGRRLTRHAITGVIRRDGLRVNDQQPARERNEDE